MSRLSAQEIVHQSTVAAVATDRSNRILAVNQRATELFEWPSGVAAKGRAFFDLVAARDVFGNRLRDEAFPFHQLVARGEPIRGFELLVSTESGKSLRTAISVVVLFGSATEGDHIVYFVRPLLRRRRADEAIERILAGGPIPTGAAPVGASATNPLTARQQEVLRLVADGLGNEEIAKALGLSVYTVRGHLREIFRKLSVRSRTQAVNQAFQRNIL